MTTKKGCLGLIMSIFGGSERADEPATELPYLSRHSVFTPAEISFYHTLGSIVEERVVICPKIGLKDVVFIPGPHNRDYIRFFNYIAKKHVDYLLCTPESMRPILAIELDDSSHKRQDRKERDAFVDKVFSAADLPLLHFTAAQTYNTASIAAAIEPYLARGKELEQTTPAPVSANAPTPPLCPRHGVPMLLRKSSKGAYAGQQFWGCPHYPDCREIIRAE